MSLFEATSKIAHPGRSLFLLLRFSHSPLHVSGAFLSVIVFLLSGTQTIFAQETVIHCDTAVSTAGYFQLSWAGAQGAEFEVQESQNTQFDAARILYKGMDTASVISGRADGIYYYRVRQLGAAAATRVWSDPVSVEVKHHSLIKAWWFFTTGAVVFILILVFILYGNKRFSTR